jgi:hypothetical protein
VDYDRLLSAGGGGPGGGSGTSSRPSTAGPGGSGGGAYLYPGYAGTAVHTYSTSGYQGLLHQWSAYMYGWYDGQVDAYVGQGNSGYENRFFNGGGGGAGGQGSGGISSINTSGSGSPNGGAGISVPSFEYNEQGTYESYGGGGGAGGMGKTDGGHITHSYNNSPYGASSKFMHYATGGGYGGGSGGGNGSWVGGDGGAGAQYYLHYGYWRDGHLYDKSWVGTTSFDTYYGTTHPSPVLTTSHYATSGTAYTGGGGGGGGYEGHSANTTGTRSGASGGSGIAYLRFTKYA